MNPTVLVVSTVHSPDDTRIRDRLIRSLSADWDVHYACMTPGPADRGDLTWLPLEGGRLRRNLQAVGRLTRGGWDVAVAHDPELIPAAIFARLAHRRVVVFDVHEDLPAQIESKGWIPSAIAAPARLLARILYRMAENALTLTLAEPGYRRLFRRDHRVFPNYPYYESWPEPTAEGDGSVSYLGDVQPGRGVFEAVAACGLAGVPIRVIGRVSGELGERLREAAANHGTDLTLIGPMPNPEALRVIAGSSVGISPLLDLPNYRHSLPTKVVEYLALGLPVVATDLPGTRRFLQPWDTVWLVSPGDPEAMAAAIKEACSPEARTRAVAQVPRVRDQYAWPAPEVSAFYRSLVSR